MKLLTSLICLVVFASVTSAKKAPKYTHEEEVHDSFDDIVDHYINTPDDAEESHEEDPQEESGIVPQFVSPAEEKEKFIDLPAPAVVKVEEAPIRPFVAESPIRPFVAEAPIRPMLDDAPIRCPDPLAGTEGFACPSGSVVVPGRKDAHGCQTSPTCKSCPVYDCFVKCAKGEKEVPRNDTNGCVLCPLCEPIQCNVKNVTCGKGFKTIPGGVDEKFVCRQTTCEPCPKTSVNCRTDLGYVTLPPPEDAPECTPDRCVHCPKSPTVHCYPGFYRQPAYANHKGCMPESCQPCPAVVVPCGFGFKAVPGGADPQTGCPLANTCAKETFAVHRAFNHKDHFYTTDSAEIGTTTLGATGKNNYTYEGIGFYIYAATKGTSVPLHRYKNEVDHFYITNTSEVGTIIPGVAGLRGYKYEGILGYIHVQQQESDSVPLHRYFNGVDHFYTTDAKEIDAPSVGYAGKYGYIYEGIEGYVFTKP